MLCLTCGTEVPTKATGRPAQYCGPDCRSTHRAALARLRREIERLERELVNADAARASRPAWARGAVQFYRAKLAQAHCDLAALLIGRWP